MSGEAKTDKEVVEKAPEVPEPVDQAPEVPVKPKRYRRVRVKKVMKKDPNTGESII